MTTVTAENTTVEKTTDKRRALGRGLDSLLPAGPRVVAGTAVAVPPANGGHSIPSAVQPEQTQRSLSGDAIAKIPLDQIDENPYQTRRKFEPLALQELAESIRTNGVVQPIVVRANAQGRYALILGERRCRAAKLAGETSIPAVVRQVSNQQAAEMTVVENLQRQDLNCLEQAQAFARLSREFGLTQEQIGQRTGCSRESVSNYVRLLKLPPEVQEYVSSGELGFSEARVLLQLADPSLIPDVARHAVVSKISVAQLTEIVERYNLPPQDKEAKAVAQLDPNVLDAQRQLEQSLGCRVRISDRNGKGKIVIQYASLEDFDRVVDALAAK